MTTNELLEGYNYIFPSLSRYCLSQNIDNCDELFNNSNKINNDKDEVEYLQQLEDFFLNDTMRVVTKIRIRKNMIERAKNFDCSKIQNLPEVLIDKIKSYLEPELNYTRKFSILRQIDSGFSWWRDVDDYLFKVPKKHIIALKKSCDIFTLYEVKSGEPKESWCRMIYAETEKYFSKTKDEMRVDKLLSNLPTEWCSTYIKPIDRWFKFFLYIHTFKKYRAELESNIKETDAKVDILKKTKIIVK